MEERLNELKPVFTDILPKGDELEFGKIYISRDKGNARLLCPCGCGTVSDIPFTEGHFTLRCWRLNISSNRIMFHPDLLEKKCPNKAHYYITFNKIQWL